MEKLQKCEIDLGGIEKEVARVFHPQLLNYNENWDQVDAMLTDIMSKDFRQRFPDSFGKGWVYNWHCLDHVDYIDNPRRREMGYHNVFDHYKSQSMKVAVALLHQQVDFIGGHLLLGTPI